MKPIFLLLCLSTFVAQGNAQSIGIDSSTKTSELYLEKGMAFLGITGGASYRESSNEETFVGKVLDREKNAFNVTLSGGYLLSDHFAVGGSVSYDWLRNNQLNEDGDGVQTDLKEAGNSITGAVFIKNFIPLSSNGRFNLYNITGMALEVKRRNTESFSQDILKRTYMEAYSISLGISPGIQVFVMEGFAAEVGVNVAGISTTSTRTSVNGENGSAVQSGVLDLKINVLSLKLGFFYFFKT